MSAGRFNLSAAALKYRELTLFFLLAVAIGGTAAYFQLGQREDPDFTFRAMVIRTIWPGATAGSGKGVRSSCWFTAATAGCALKVSPSQEARWPPSPRSKSLR